MKSGVFTQRSWYCLSFRAKWVECKDPNCLHYPHQNWKPVDSIINLKCSSAAALWPFWSCRIGKWHHHSRESVASGHTLPFAILQCLLHSIIEHYQIVRALWHCTQQTFVNLLVIEMLSKIHCLPHSWPCPFVPNCMRGPTIAARQHACPLPVFLQQGRIENFVSDVWGPKPAVVWHFTIIMPRNSQGHAKQIKRHFASSTSRSGGNLRLLIANNKSSPMPFSWSICLAVSSSTPNSTLTTFTTIAFASSWLKPVTPIKCPKNNGWNPGLTKNPICRGYFK